MARSRNRRGQFTKRSSGGSSAYAIATVPRSSPARRGSRSVRRGSGGVPRHTRRRGSSSTSNRVRGGVAAAGFALGYVNKNYSTTIQKLPPIKGSHILTGAVIGHFLLKPRPGSWGDHAVTAAAAIGGYEVGSSGIIGDDSTPTWGG